LNRSTTPLVWGRVVPGSDVHQLWAGVNEAGEVDRLVGRSVVGDHDDRRDLAGVGVRAVIEQRTAQQCFGVANRGFQGGDRVVFIIILVFAFP
jgi:hypothetical protein